MIGIAMLASLNAAAQSSSTSATTAAPATQTTATSAAAVKPAAAKKFGATVLLQAFANVADVGQNGSNAIIDSSNSLGVSYKISDTLKTEVRHNFQARNVSDNGRLESQKTDGNVAKEYIGDLSSDNGANSTYKTLDPTIHLNVKTQASLLGSEAMTIASRYYVPASESSQAAHSLGILRTQTALEWNLNPKVTVAVMPQFRFYFYDGAATSDPMLYSLPAVSATYNFNDNLSAYYQPYLLLQAKDYTRGNFNANKVNTVAQEIGMNIVVGKVTINPAYTATASSLKEEGYKGMGDTAFAEYDLNIIGSF